MRKVIPVDVRAMRFRDLGTVVLEQNGVELAVGGPNLPCCSPCCSSTATGGCRQGR
jgi:hypothetical protein